MLWEARAGIDVRARAHGNGRPEARYELLLERCPWCGTPFDATRGYHADVGEGFNMRREPET